MKLSRYAVVAAVILSASIALAASEAQKSFDAIKSLEGTWEGKNSQGQTVKVVVRPTSGGSAVLHEIQGPENMITMFALDGDRLLMTHYCAVGNQPRMKATLAPDGKSVTFDFIDATNLSAPDAGHMQHAVFSMTDANHHSELWRFLDHGKEMKEEFVMVRSK